MHSNRRGKWGHQGDAVGCSETTHRGTVIRYTNQLSLKKEKNNSNNNKTKTCSIQIETQGMRQILYLHSVCSNVWPHPEAMKCPWGWFPLRVSHSRQKEQWALLRAIDSKASFYKLWDLAPVSSITYRMKTETPTSKGVGALHRKHLRPYF